MLPVSLIFPSAFQLITFNSTRIRGFKINKPRCTSKYGMSQNLMTYNSIFASHCIRCMERPMIYKAHFRKWKSCYLLFYFLLNSRAEKIGNNLDSKMFVQIKSDFSLLVILIFGFMSPANSVVSISYRGK